MKNKALLSVLLLTSVLFFSACSSKKNEVKNAQEIKNNPVQSQETASSSEKSAVNNYNQTTKACNVGKVLFRYPNAWGGCVETKNGVSFRTDDSPYQVDLVLTLNETTGEGYNNNEEHSFNSNTLISGNGAFFEEAQGGALMGGYIQINNNYYRYNFNIVSNQPALEEGDGVWTPNNNVSKDNLISILRSAELNYKVLTLEKCGKEATKISTLKVGDFYKTHKIKKISGNLLEKNCENSCSEFPDGLGLSVLFDGEETVSGTLFYTDYVFSLAFVPDDKTWTPDISIESNSSDYVLNGISCGNGFSIKNDLNDSVVTKLPNIKNFLTNAKNGDKYPKKVSITIKNLTTTFLSGGESGTMAELVDVKEIE
ncbi:MAG: hypothetical protein ACOYMB_00190 [Patescibacteria group bacterium]